MLIHAARIDEDFMVNGEDGTVQTGKAGDYLVEGKDGELYPCDGQYFREHYEDVPITGPIGMDP